jgi:ribosomal protein S21
VCKAKECYNVEVQIEDDEPAEMCVRYFEREVARAGIFHEWRRRRFYENKKEEQKRKTQERARLRRR